MDRQIAFDVYEGRIPPPDDLTTGELIQLALGACLEDNGDIWCLKCNKPNECCDCYIQEDNDEDDLLVEEETGEIEDCFLVTEENKNILIEGRPVFRVEEQYCDKCGRSVELCDCQSNAD